MTKREAEINERRRVKFQEDKLFAFRVNLDHILRNPEHESKLKEWLPDKATIRALVNPPKRKPPPPPDPDLLTEQMLAARWHCSSSRLQYWRSHGIGIPYAKIGGKVLYRLEEVIEFEKNSLIRPRR